jgi:hypothetical protein
MLLLLFYFVHSILIFLKCFITFSSFTAVAFTIWDWFWLLVPHNFATPLTFATALLVAVTWFCTEHWALSNFISFSLCCAGISFVKIQKLQIVVTVCIGFLLYDVYWVFLSPAAFGKSVMVEAATHAAPHMPIAFTAPRAGHASMIGAGDIVLPGIVLDFFMRFDALHGSGLFAVAFAGYCAGLMLAWAAVHLMEKGQPALLWIFPAVLAPTLAVAAWQGLLAEMWETGAIDPAAVNGTDIGSEVRENVLT